MIKVSVIVPLHNSEKYLGECLESIIHQSLKEIEILCIDSSSDNTINILKEYQKKDPRIKIIEDLNSSYGHKLNVGIEQAKGKYIAIVESDDYIETKMLEGLYNTAEDKKVDVVKSNYRMFFDTDRNRKFKEFRRGINYLDYDRVIYIKKEKDKRVQAEFNIWTGLYNKEFIQNNGIKVHESPGASYQDSGFSILVCLLMEKICFVSDFYYNYRIDNMGASVKSNEKYAVIIDEFCWIREQMIQKGIEGIEEELFFKKKCVAAYFWNYERLSIPYRKLFVDLVKNKVDSECSGIRFRDELDTKKLILCGDIEEELKFRKQELHTQKSLQEIKNIFSLEKEIVLFGAGNYGKQILYIQDLLDTNHIRIICDNDKNKENSCISGIHVKGIIDGINQYPNALYIIASKIYADEMIHQLGKLGILDERIYIIDEALIYGKIFEYMAEYWCKSKK